MVTKLKTGTGTAAAEEEHVEGDTKEESSTTRYRIEIRLQLYVSNFSLSERNILVLIGTSVPWNGRSTKAISSFRECS